MPDEVSTQVEQAPISDAQIEAQVDAIMSGGNAEPSPEPAEGAHDGSADAPITNQKDFNAALRNRLGEERDRVTRRFEESPEYRLGKQLLNDRMSRENMTAEQAYQALMDERVQNQAKFYKENQEAFYQDWIKSQTESRQPKNSPEGTASDLAHQLLDARERGIMPANFRPENIDATFVKNAQAYGVEGALAIWQGAAGSALDQRSAMAEELARRQQMPQPMRSTGDNVEPRPVDFRNMSKEEFERWDAAFKRRAR